MIKDNKILLGKAEEKEIYVYPSMLNRHGLIAGATGTGKTITLKVLAESMSQLGIATVIADVKADLTGMIQEGDLSVIQERLNSMGIEAFPVQKYPVHFFDVFQKKGHPVRASIQEMGPRLFARALELTEAQEGVLTIIFKVAEDMELDIIDIKDLQAMVQYVSEHSAELSGKYGNIARATTGVIQRKVLKLEQEGGDIFFGMPALNIQDWITTEGGLGMMNILECEELFQHPLLYAVFLNWMLEELYTTLPEVGDTEKPKVVFFFDEAHLLFDGASKEFLRNIERTVKLIRSKGVGVFFITQNPADIPDSVLAQLGNRIQHALRAYTPTEIRALRLAADSFRANPDFDTSEKITQLKTGQALVSVLDSEGTPSVVEVTKILPPQSKMGILEDTIVQQYISSDSIYGKYEKAFDPDSAYEEMERILDAEEKEKEAAIEEAQKAKEKARVTKQKEQWVGRLQRKATNKVENELVNMGVRSAKKFLKGFIK